MKIAFWNVHHKSIDNLIVDLILENKIDIMILAEYSSDIDLLCNKANSKETRYSVLNAQKRGCDKITGIYYTGYQEQPLFSCDRYYITSIKTVCFEMLFAFIHAPSNMYRSDSDRMTYFYHFYHEIEKCESVLLTNNTVILGDLNSNPFDKSILSASALHSIPYKEEAMKEKRTIDGIQYKLFYNPSWKFLTQDIPPYGTYYYTSSGYTNYFWNTFDQVIIRPKLINAFVDGSLLIIHEINGVSLLKSDYKPNKDDYSDHLPIVFEMKEENIQ